MNPYLHHSHLASQEAIAGTIVAQSLLTIAGLRFRGVRGLRVVIGAGCVALLWLAITAVHGILTNPHFDGYILLIGLLLIVQVGLTLLSFVQNERLSA